MAEIEGKNNPCDEDCLIKEYLKSKLAFYREGSFVFGVVENENCDEFVDKFMAVDSSCYVRSEVHSKEKCHKRFSSTGKYFLQRYSFSFLLKIEELTR